MTVWSQVGGTGLSIVPSHGWSIFRGTARRPARDGNRRATQRSVDRAALPSALRRLASRPSPFRLRATDPIR